MVLQYISSAMFIGEGNLFFNEEKHTYKYSLFLSKTQVNFFFMAGTFSSFKENGAISLVISPVITSHKLLLLISSGT